MGVGVGDDRLDGVERVVGRRVDVGRKPAGVVQFATLDVRRPAPQVGEPIVRRHRRVDLRRVDAERTYMPASMSAWLAPPGGAAELDPQLSLRGRARRTSGAPRPSSDRPARRRARAARSPARRPATGRRACGCRGSRPTTRSARRSRYRARSRCSLDQRLLPHHRAYALTLQGPATKRARWMSAASGVRPGSTPFTPGRCVSRCQT